MKKWQTKTINIGQTTDIDAEMNALGEAGWHFATLLMTQFGAKIMLQRELDEDVDGKTFTDELAKKFGV